MRELAAAAGLPVARKPESQDLCFLAGTGAQGFLRRHGGERIRAAEAGGDIVDRRGRVLGRHAGHHRFTVGQRRGLGVAAEQPLFVLGKDPARNGWSSGPAPSWPRGPCPWRQVSSTATGAVRARSGCAITRPQCPARMNQDLRRGPVASMDATLAREVAATAAGQTACLMDGDLVVGWGTLAGRAGG